MTELEREIAEALTFLPPGAVNVRLQRFYVVADVPLAALDHIETRTHPRKLERLRQNWNPAKLHPLHIWAPPPPGGNPSPIRDGNHRLTHLRSIGADMVPVLLRLGSYEVW